MTAPVLSKAMGTAYRTYKCPCCHDTGYEIKRVPADEAYGAPLMADWPAVDIAVPCRKCGGRVIDGIDSGFPGEFHDVDITRFRWDAYGDTYGKYMADMRKIVDSFWENYNSWSMDGMGLYIWSNTRGTGKTFLACCLGQSVKLKYRASVKFVTSIDYLAAVTESYREENRGMDSSQTYRDCDLLILDDLGAEIRSTKNNWTDKEFFRLLNGRFSQGKVTIITSNMALSDLKIDDRISSRINAKSIIIALPEVSIRNMSAKKTKKEFIDKVCANGGEMR